MKYYILNRLEYKSSSHIISVSMNSNKLFIQYVVFWFPPPQIATPLDQKPKGMISPYQYQNEDLQLRVFDFYNAGKLIFFICKENSRHFFRSKPSKKMAQEPKKKNQVNFVFTIWTTFGAWLRMHSGSFSMNELFRTALFELHFLVYNLKCTI